MIDLSTEYLGLQLRSPIVASSSPLCKKLDSLSAIEDAGAGAVVLHSLFEEEITGESEFLERALNQAGDGTSEANTFFPDFRNVEIGAKGYLEHIRKAKKRLKIPVIGSLNGVSNGGWTRYAKEIEAAGADALELNIYLLPATLERESQDIEEQYCDLVASVRAQVRIPVAVKLAPYFTSVPNMAARLDRLGVQGLVLFNRFYQPDIDIEALSVQRTLELSTSEELRLRLHWVAILCGRIRPDLAITGGVHTFEDVLKGIMAGAKITMMTSALLRNGIAHITRVKNQVTEWMEEHEYESVRQMCGSMNALAVADPALYGRANYVHLLSSYAPRFELR
jgi:dihydroorotate dehydrogenase (fumarate)